MAWFGNVFKSARMSRSDIDETIRRIQEKTRDVDPGSEEFRRLRVDLEQELKNKKLVKEMRFGGVRLCLQDLDSRWIWIVRRRSRLRSSYSRRRW